MAEQMQRRHKNLFHTITREQFVAAVSDLDRRIPTLQRHEIIVGLMRIAAMIGDGHTNVSPLKDPKFGFRSLPLKLYLFEDGIYVRAAAPEQAELVGARVEKFGDVPAEEALRHVAEISPKDNEITPKLYAPIFLAMPEVLHALKMSARPDVALLQLRKGTRNWTATVPAGGVDPSWPPDTDISLVTPEGWVDARTAPQLPVWLQAPLDYHRMIELPEQKALYIQLNMVSGVKNQTLDQFGERIGERVKAINPRAVIVDLRLNRGGNGDLRNGFVRELIKAEDEDTRLFVLTWRGTFSASQFILDDLDRLSKAVLIGEPASSKPNSYGDSYRNILPNSGLTVRTSTRWHQTGHNRHQYTPIDIAAAYSFTDYISGRDPALEAALNYKPKPSLEQRLLEAAKEKGFEGVREAFGVYQADPANRYQDIERIMILAGDKLYQAKHNEAAVRLLELGTERFPKNPDMFLVLAQLADFTGKPDLARKAATKVLELEPDSRSAKSLLDKLQAPK